MNKELADRLIDDLCTEVYKTGDGVCLVLVGKRVKNKVLCAARGVCANAYELDDMVNYIQKYQLEQYHAIDKNGILHLTGIQIDKEMERRVDGE